MTEKAYAMVLAIENQRKKVIPGCFDCGKIIIAAVNDVELGELAICRTPKKQCPQFGSEMDEAIGEVNGTHIYLRKLQ